MSLAAEVETGLAIDFQYVSTAPPISSVTPLNGVMMFTQNKTYNLGESRDNRANSTRMTDFSNDIEPVI